jgi:hypothetical protein
MYEDDPRLRELCEKASKELDHDRLITLVRQISELLEKRKRRPGVEPMQKKAAPVLRSPAQRLSCPGANHGAPPRRLGFAWQM